MQDLFISGFPWVCTRSVPNQIISSALHTEKYLITGKLWGFLEHLPLLKILGIKY